MKRVNFNIFNCVVKIFKLWKIITKSGLTDLPKILFFTVKEMTEGKIETSFFKRYYANSKTIVPFVNNVKINRVLK
jgi:hypothetical protein